MKRIYLARHGETVGNVQKFSQLPTTELTDKGHDGAKALAQRLSSLDIDALLVSPYTRAQQTASYVEADKGIVAETIDSLHELVRPTEVVGKVYNEETLQMYQKYFDEFWLEEMTMTGAENYRVVTDRVAQTLQIIRSRSEESIAVVAHGDFIRFMVTYVLVQKNDPVMLRQVYDSLVRINNVGITVLEDDGESMKVKMYNDHSHFADN